MNSPNLSEIQELIESILRKAGTLFTEPTERYFSFKTFNRADVKEVSYLGSAVVTTLDVLVQDFIQARLLEEGYDTFGMMAEEDTALTVYFPQHARFQWVIDPLDGTLNFLSGQKKFLQYIHDRFGKENFESYYQAKPEYSSTILGLKGRGEQMRDEFLVCGIYFPFTDIFYTAIRGEGSYKNGMRFFQQKSSGQGLIKTNSPLFRKLRGKSERLVKAEGAGPTLIDIAERGEHTYLVKEAGIYDTGPLSLIVTEAGGAVTDIYGDFPCLDDTGTKFESFLASSSQEKNLKAVRFLRDEFKFNFERAI
jgi:fructose-1,6-bisphosphatase/inositol monophosphatase family enzyme